MANEGELPDLDLKMPSLDLDMPTLSLDLPDADAGASAALPAQGGMTPAGTPDARPAGKEKKAKEKKIKEKKVKEKKVKAPGPGIFSGISGAVIPAMLDIISIILLLFIVAIMYVFEVPVNVVPELTLTTYVQSLWLFVGCFIVMAMLHDIKTALVHTGLDIVLLLTVFPTLLLLMDTPMNPMYFYVLGMVVLELIIAMPLSVINARKEAAKKSAPAGAGASPATATGPNLSS